MKINQAKHDDAERVLNQALEFEGEARDSFLKGACGEDADLRDRVATLIRAHEEADQFLKEGLTLEDGSISEKAGTMIGRYKLLQQVGEGGMGVVYMAEQTEPIKRKVALKIIKLGMDTKQVVARFEAERQALAMMDHPHIAKVLDAGATDTGRPYFVMELVRGVAVTEYCQKNKLTTQERLDLFIYVSQAIQHAHQKGVIHRDIKPSNVLVTLNDGVPHPMVIDFGIAKATNHTLTEKTLFTNYAQMIGTPAYMSPEQAEMSKMDVDTRTDVYSLGVLLYELLTGTTPFSSNELMSKGYGEMQRIIAEAEPDKPSTRLRGTVVAAASSSGKPESRADSAAIQALEGDLDWIIMRCLEKDRTRRYETVNGLVADVQRHLNNEPVTAAAPTFGYQLQKLYRRNRPVMRVAIGSAFLLLVATVISLWFAVSANQQKNKTEVAHRLAESESIKADKLVSMMIDTIENTIGRLFAEGRAEEAVGMLNDLDRQAEVLEEVPQAEYRLRRRLMIHYRFWDHHFLQAAKQARRLEELLPLLDDGQLEETRLSDQILIAGMLLPGPLQQQESIDYDQIVTRFKKLVSAGKLVMPEDTPAVRRGMGFLGLHYMRSEDRLLANHYLREAIAGGFDDVLGLSQFFWTLIQNNVQVGNMDVANSLIQHIPTPLPRKKDSFLVMESVVGGYHILSRLLAKQGQFDRAEALLDRTVSQMRSAGWPDAFVFAMTNARANVLAYRGDFSSVKEALAVYKTRKFRFVSEWKMAMWAADTAGLVEERQRFIKIGLLQFGSALDHNLLREMVCYPMTEDMLADARFVIERMKSEASSPANEPRIIRAEALIAVRQGKRARAQAMIDQFKSLHGFDTHAHSAIEALYHAMGSDRDAALEAFAAATESERRYHGKRQGVYTYQSVRLEAEALLTAKDWLVAE